MPRYNFLDEAGLKKYHQLAGYSEIPITDYKAGSLNTENGNVISNASKRVTDYIELPIYYKYSAVVKGSGIICYYSSSGEFIKAETFTDSVSFTLNNITKTVNISGAIMTLRAAKIRISCNLQAAVEGTKNTPFIIRSLHDNTSKWLYDEIVENENDIATNSTEINNVKNMVYKAHCTHNIKLSKTIVEVGTSTSVYATRLNFLFNNKNQSASDGVTSAKIYKTDGGVIAGINNSNINTDITNDSTTLLGNPNSTVTVNPGYEIMYNGNKFTGSYKITAVHPIYYGGGGVGTISGGSGVSITKDNLRSRFGSSTLKTSASGTYTITLSSKNYIFVVSPYEISTDKIFNASTGFKFPMDPLGTLTVTNIGAGAANATYYVYRSNELDPGTYNIQIK